MYKWIFSPSILHFQLLRSISLSLFLYICLNFPGCLYSSSMSDVYLIGSMYSLEYL